MWGRGVWAGRAGRRRCSCRLKPACVWPSRSWAVGDLALPGRGGSSRRWPRPVGCAALLWLPGGAFAVALRPLVPVRPHRWPSLVASPHSCRRPQTQGSAGPSRCGRGPSSHPATGRGPRGHADAVPGPLRTRPQSGIEGGPTNSAPGQPPRWEQPQGREDARSRLASGSRARPADPAPACTPAPSAASEKPGNESAEETRFAFSGSRKVQVLFILQNPEVRVIPEAPALHTGLRRALERGCRQGLGQVPGVSRQRPPRTPGWPNTSGLGCGGDAAAKCRGFSRSCLLSGPIMSCRPRRL